MRSRMINGTHDSADGDEDDYDEEDCPLCSRRPLFFVLRHSGTLRPVSWPPTQRGIDANRADTGGHSTPTPSDVNTCHSRADAGTSPPSTCPDSHPRRDLEAEPHVPASVGLNVASALGMGHV